MLMSSCPVDRDWPNALLDSDGDGVIDRLDRLGAGNALAGNIQNPQFDDTDAVMTALASKKLLAFKEVAHGFYFWNFRNELEPSWSWLAARDAKYAVDEDDVRTAAHAIVRGQTLDLMDELGDDCIFVIEPVIFACGITLVDAARDAHPGKATAKSASKELRNEALVVSRRRGPFQHP